MNLLVKSCFSIKIQILKQILNYRCRFKLHRAGFLCKQKHLKNSYLTFSVLFFLILFNLLSFFYMATSYWHKLNGDLFSNSINKNLDYRMEILFFFFSGSTRNIWSNGSERWTRKTCKFPSHIYLHFTWVHVF